MGVSSTNARHNPWGLHTTPFSVLLQGQYLAALTELIAGHIELGKHANIDHVSFSRNKPAYAGHTLSFLGIFWAIYFGNRDNSALFLGPLKSELRRFNCAQSQGNETQEFAARPCCLKLLIVAWWSCVPLGEASFTDILTAKVFQNFSDAAIEFQDPMEWFGEYCEKHRG